MCPAEAAVSGFSHVGKVGLGENVDDVAILLLSQRETGLDDIMKVLPPEIHKLPSFQAPGVDGTYYLLLEKELTV